MICAIHQPNYIPYLGFFDKYNKSDVFVLYDTAQYSKNEFHNRNRIKTEKGAKWLTIPVHVSLGEKIKEVRVADKEILKKHLDTIKNYYKKSIKFKESFEWLGEIYNSINNPRFLVDINIPILLNFFKLIDPTKKIILASELNISPGVKKTDALVQICKKVRANVYLSGMGAKDYLEVEKFTKENIKVVWQNFHHPLYPQLYGEFVPNLSIIDALLNIGEEGLKQLFKK